MKLTNKERDARNRKIREMYQEGATIQQIAKALKLNRETVRQTLERYGMREKRKLPEPGDTGVQMAVNRNTAKPYMLQGKRYTDLTDCIAGR